MISDATLVAGPKCRSLNNATRLRQILPSPAEVRMSEAFIMTASPHESSSSQPASMRPPVMWHGVTSPSVSMRLQRPSGNCRDEWSISSLSLCARGLSTKKRSAKKQQNRRSAVLLFGRFQQKLKPFIGAQEGTRTPTTCVATTSR